MWKFLEEAPACRSLYENVLESLGYPLQFCGHRWYENEEDTQSAEMILEGYRKSVLILVAGRKVNNPMVKVKAFNI